MISSKEDFVICEIGGIVGDIESLPFVEAIRQFANDMEIKNIIYSFNFCSLFKILR